MTRLRTTLALALGLLVAAPAAAQAAAPSITITLAPPATPTSANFVPVEWSVRDDDGDVHETGATCIHNGAALTCTAMPGDGHLKNGWWTGGVVGANTLTIRVTDKAGNVAETTVTWTMTDGSTVPEPPPAPGTFTAPKTAKVDGKGRVRVTFTCAAPQGCAATSFTLRGLKGRHAVAAGPTTTVTVKLARKELRKLGRKRSVTVKR